jgi:hypothetical protein
MDVEFSEPSRHHDRCELRLGGASWNAEDRSAKFAWRTRTGAWARGGELPVSALPELLEFAIRKGYCA